MSKYTQIKKLYRDYENADNTTIRINGWIRNIRVSKTFGFIEITDGSCFKTAQVVFEDIENFNEIAHLNTGAAIRVTGKVVITPNAKQPYEINASEICVEGVSTPEYPLQPKRHSFEFLRTLPHLRPRTNTFAAVFRVRSMLAYAVHKFFNERGFVYVHTPIITGKDCEGAGEMFQVTTLGAADKAVGGADNTRGDFFGMRANLTVSGQLDVEGFAAAFGNVYTFDPAFRAENSNTARHAAEFRMIEPEIAFADLNDDMCLAEDMLKYIISYILENAPDEMEFFNTYIEKGLLENLRSIVDCQFVRITYTKAIALLQESGVKFDYPAVWGEDLQTEHERYITEEIYKSPVFITDYPKDIKAFYMRLNDDGKTVAAMDLLVPGVGELIGGSQREERLDVLLRRMEECGLDCTAYSDYIDLRRYGTNKHAGFGLGFERAVMFITGMKNIRDVIPYPRTIGNLR